MPAVLLVEYFCAQSCHEPKRNDSMHTDRSEPTEANDYRPEIYELIAGSYQRLTGQSLLACPDENEAARRLYQAPFAILAHDTAVDPVFCYANRMAQELFEMTWDEMVGMPSWKSAEPMFKADRQKFLDQVAVQGFIHDYSGIRISRSGRRFLIQQATVWNLLDQFGVCRGQAAAINSWSAV